MNRRPTDKVRTLSVRARLARHSIVLIPAALAALPFAPSAHAAQVSTSWISAASGNWFDATKWSGGVPSNNGVNIYDATVSAVGSPYAIALANDVTVNSLTLSSPAATINHTFGTLLSAHPINVSAGTYNLNGGTISGGTINLSGGGTLSFGGSSGRLDGTVVNGGLALSTFNGGARLMDGARFTGNATLSAAASILNYEYDATLAPGQTIMLGSDTASLGVARNSTTNLDSTLTIAPGAAVRGRGRITHGIYTGGTANRLVNDGTIAADAGAGTLDVQTTVFVNNGALTGGSGAALKIGSDTFNNNGSVNVGTGGTAEIVADNWTNNAGRTIAATGGTLTTGGNWSNAGTISVNNAELNLGGTFTTAGINLPNFARSGGTVNVTGSLNNTGATLPLTAATGSWRMSNGTITGGTITRAGGADLVFTSNNGVLDGATLVGDLGISIGNARARLKNGADFTGNATVTATGAILNYEYDATIGPGRTINLDGANNSLGVGRNDTAGSDSTLTIAPGALVRGRGNITSGVFTGGSNNRVVNSGTIAADVSGNTLTINPNVFTNNGHARAATGSTLVVSSGSWSNAAGGSISVNGAGTADFRGNWSSPGSINLASGATLNMDGTFATSGMNLAGIARTGSTTINLTGNLNNAGSTLALTGTTGSWRLKGGVISGGTITRAGGADLVFTSSGGVLSGVTVPGDLTAFNESSALVSMRNGADFTGNATLSASGTVLNYEYDATIGAGRTINLENASATLGVARGGTPALDRTLTIAPGALVRGRGQITSGIAGGGTANRVVNNGTIAGDVTGGSFTVTPDLFTNNSAVRGVNGSTLTINADTWSNAATGSIELNNATGTFSGVWSNAGSVILNNATLNMAGTMTTGGLGLANFTRAGATTVNLVGALNNNAATLALGANSGSVRLAGGTITGGTITRSGGSDLVFTSAGVLDNVRIIGDVSLHETSARARLRNGADFTGSATLSASGALLSYEYDATIDAGRTINMQGSSATVSVGRNDTTATDSTLTIAPGATIRGRGIINSGNFTGGSANRIVNNGLINADLNNPGLQISPNLFTNNGTLLASNGGSMSISNTTFTNTGRLRATGGGQIRVFTMAGDLNDSSADGAGSMIDLDGASYAINQPMPVTNNAMLYLRGGWQKNADLNVGGRVVFDYPAPGPESTTFDTIKAQILSGRNNGLWNGPGINSSQAAANANFGLGYAESTTLFPAGSGGTWAGQSVDGHAVLVAYTRYGDADLNFTVNLADFNRLASNFGQSNKLWTDGDFDYNGIVNLADFNKLAANFGLSTAGPEVTPGDWARLGASVPEPTSSAVLFGVAASTALSRRRRR